MEIETLLSVDGHGVKGNGQERDGRGGVGGYRSTAWRSQERRERRRLGKDGRQGKERPGKLLFDEDSSGKMYNGKRRVKEERRNAECEKQNLARKDDEKTKQDKIQTHTHTHL